MLLKWPLIKAIIVQSLKYQSGYKCKILTGQKVEYIKVMWYCYAIHESPTGLKTSPTPPMVYWWPQCMCMTNLPVHLINNMTTFRKKNVLTFKPLVCKGKIFACMLLYVSFPLIYICNTTPFRKKTVLTLWPHPRGWVGAKGQNYCLHIVVLNLICNMTIFRKKQLLWHFDPTQGPRGCVCCHTYALPGEVLLQKGA